MTTYAAHTCRMFPTAPHSLSTCSWHVNLPLPRARSHAHSHNVFTMYTKSVSLNYTSVMGTQRHMKVKRPMLVQYVFISLSEKLNLCIRHAETEGKHKYSTMKMNSTESRENKHCSSRLSNSAEGNTFKWRLLLI